MSHSENINHRKNISLFIKYFYRNANELIEETYLRPYHVRKTPLRDGNLEREHHGALHARRVSLYVKALHRVISEQLPNHVRPTLKTLSQELQLTENQIIAFASFAGLSYNSGRKGEGMDY
ncbi:MAG TPA: hypothetical protein PLD88_00250, partial [Candidatus Berkiella sp.]|nr:hypothetical protein [Candidatus Berkiella sp.]